VIDGNANRRRLENTRKVVGTCRLFRLDEILKRLGPLWLDPMGHRPAAAGMAV